MSDHDHRHDHADGHEDGVVVIDEAALDALSAAAAAAPRGRMNRNLHAMEDPVHRLLNATEPRTYVQPHRHLAAPRVETLSVLRGRGAVALFRDDGALARVVVLGPVEPVRALEIPPSAFHTLVALEPGTVWLEAKQGPYVPIPDADRAPWAPAEGDASATSWLTDLRAQIEGGSAA